MQHLSAFRRAFGSLGYGRSAIIEKYIFSDDRVISDVLHGALVKPAAIKYPPLPGVSLFARVQP